MVSAAVGDLPCFKDLIAVLFECLLIISLGYLSGRFNLISTQAKDLNSYLTTFALPMIIFLNIAQMEFQAINLSFLICMLTAKLLVFILVTILTITISYPKNFGYAGALAILATQSNDFALGYPLIKSLYGEAKPEMLNYLSLMAPIQLLILNPLGIAMLEYNKSKQLENNPASGTQSSCCYLSTSQPSLSPNRHHQNYTDTQSSQAITAHQAHQQSKQQLRQRKQGHLLTRPSTHAADVVPANDNGVPDTWQPPSSKVKSPEDQIRPLTNHKQNEELHRHNITTRSRGFRHRNIKALSLIMPSSNPNIGGSEDSLHSLSEYGTECKFVDHLSQQTRNNHNLDCQLVRPTVQQHSVNPSITELNVDLPPLATTGTVDLDESNQSPPDITTTATKRGCTVNLNFLKALATNPLIIASVVALLVNLIHGPELPKFVTRVSNTIAASFASPALFVVGLSMYGKFELFRRNPSDLLLSSVLVLTKVLILPNLMRTLALIILPRYTPAKELSYLIDFSFLYGLLPTAPTACIIANQYGVLSNVVSISMLLSTFISTPLMISSAFLINPATVIKVEVIEDILSQTMQVSSVVTLTLALLTLYAFWKSKKNRNYTNFMNIAEVARGSINKITAKPTHAFLLLLAISQTIIGMGGLVCYFVDTGKLDPVLNIDPIHHSIAAFEENVSRKPFNGNITLLVAPETVTMLPVPLQEPLAPPDPLPGLEPISGLDSIPLIEPTSESLLEPSALSDHVDSITITHHVDLGLKILSTAQHVFSSYGLMMARFTVLCLLATIGAMKFKGELVGKRVAAIMLKAYLVLGTTLLIWLVFDSDQTKHLPVEASLPNHSSSLWVRLLYDIIILTISIPLFALIIRSYNKDKIVLEQNDKLIVTDNEVGPDLIKRRFVTSSASLSSDASSALTSNTNLESASNASQCVQMSHDLNNNLSNDPSNDSLAIVREAGHYEVKKRSVSPVDGQIVCPLANISNSTTNNSSLFRDDTRSGNVTIQIDSNRQYELDDPTNNRHTSAPVINYRNHLTLPEFNKYSLLIVFILINSTHNMTSIAQKLLIQHPFGTFRQIEVTNAALEFGQGLLTFLIYGMRGFSS